MTKKDMIHRTFNENKLVEQKYHATNTSISVAAFEGGVVQIHVNTPDPNTALTLWKKLHEELKRDKNP